MKKQWRKPELVVLVRTNPEEAILGYCKTSSDTGPSDLYSGCYEDELNCTSCLYFGGS